MRLPSSAPITTIEAKPDGASRRVVFASGASIILEPLKVTGRRAGVVAECAVRIGGRMIATIGKQGSATEVLECHRLEEVGALPALRGQLRLGLIYAPGSPNTDYRVAVMLVEQADGQWVPDDDAFERFAEAGVDTVKGMAKRLNKAQIDRSRARIRPDRSVPTA